MDPDNSDSRASRLYECPEICKGGKTIVDMRCGSFHIGVINSAGEVFLGGDADSGKLGFQTAKYYGMKKFVSEHIFSTIAVVSDVTILGSRDGTLIAFGQRSGLLDYDEEDYDEKLYSHTVLQFPSIEQVSAQGGEVVVCTTQGEVYITNLKERRVVLGTYSTAYNAISQCIIDHTYVCLSDKRNGVLDIFLLMPRTMHRKELQDIIILH
jgi:alpha-tubulin suppressor-like RCC1 family protein